MTLPTPLAYYKFNTVGSTIPDDAGGLHPLSVSGAGASLDDGRVGTGLRLTGESYVVGRDSIVPVGGTGTVACWFSVDADLVVGSFPAGLMGLWSQDDDGFNRTGPSIFPASSSTFKLGRALGTAANGSSPELPCEEMHHLSAFLAAGQLWFKVDGGEPFSVQTGAAFSPGGFRVGYASSFHTLGFYGVIDELVLYAETLTEEQQEEIYAIGLAGQSIVEVEMSNITSLSLLRYGKHTSNTQLESDASVTYGFCEHEGDIALTQGPAKLERNLRRGDGERYSRLVGPRAAPALGWNTLLRGLDANSGGAVTTAKQTEIAPLLDVITGANGTGGTGSVAAASGHTSTTLVVDDASAIPVGAGVLFETSTEWVAREVVSKSSNTLTLDRAYGGTPVDDGIVYCGVSWYPDNDAPNHVHLAADLENLGLDRVKMFGGMGALVVDFPANGGLAMCAWSFDFSHDDDDESPASPTFSGPTVGNAIPCIDGTFWVGATELLLRDAKLNVTPAKTAKQHYAALNGFAGYVVTGIDVTLTGTLLMGALSSEATQTTRRTLQGASTQDIALQLGRGPGASVYVRLPAADFDAVKASVDGQDALTFTAMATRSSNQANVPGAARLHLF